MSNGDRRRALFVVNPALPRTGSQFGRSLLELAGKLAKCPKCGTACRLPALEDETVEVEAEVAMEKPAASSRNRCATRAPKGVAGSGSTASMGS